MSTLLNSNTTRNRTILTVALVVAVGLKLVLPRLSEPLNRKQELLAVELRAIEDLEQKVKLSDVYLKQIRETGSRSLHPEPTIAAIRYQDWLRSDCEGLGLADPIIALKEPLPVVDVGATIPVNLNASGTIEKLGDWIDSLSAANLTHRISNLKLHGWDSITGDMRCTIDLEALSMKDNPVFNDQLFAQERRLRGLGAYLAEHNHFARYAPPKPVTEIASTEDDGSRSMPTATLRSPGPDILASIRLVGIVARNNQQYALLRDELTNTDILIDARHHLTIVGFAARVVRFEAQGVVLLRGKAEVPVSLGQTLRQGLESMNGDFIQ